MDQSENSTKNHNKHVCLCVCVCESAKECVSVCVWTPNYQQLEAAH